ncbi:MAG: phosphoribosylformylglycinamidine synthase [Flavobacteriales bacterium]|nr:phosphoribosylformylglycinamidine synthase [Flavobacteriales bacterium]
MKQYFALFVAFFPLLVFVQADSLNKARVDSLYIENVQDVAGQKAKVLHAEPLYIDLIRDLGARKGEKEWNLGLGMLDNIGFDQYEMLVEYEWAVMDRLGMEVEVPFTIFSPQQNIASDSIPSDRIESLKLAAQWSFFVSEKWATTMALGYIHEFEFSDLDNFVQPYFDGQLFNPFLVVAKRWGPNWHTLIYTGPQLFRGFNGHENHFQYEMHSNLHYMIPGTRNFLGMEVNKYFYEGGSDITLRPQMRVGIADNFMIGILTGIPINKRSERFSTFIRLIWEPGHTTDGPLKTPFKQSRRHRK